MVGAELTFMVAFSSSASYLHLFRMGNHVKMASRPYSSYELHDTNPCPSPSSSTTASGSSTQPSRDPQPPSSGVGCNASSSLLQSSDGTYRIDLPPPLAATLGVSPPVPSPHPTLRATHPWLDEPPSSIPTHISPSHVSYPSDYYLSGSESDWRWRQRQLRDIGIKRGPTRKVKLVQGTVLSADYPVPGPIQNAMQAKYRTDPSSDSEEFSHMRYTAATCDPNNFTLNTGYSLRPHMYNRHTEILIGVTIYNEDKILLSRTLHSIMQNIRDIVNLKKSEFWNSSGPAWQKIVLCIIIDGISSCDKACLDILSTVGVYQDGVMKRDIDGKETVAHLFEYTTQLSVTPNQQLILPHDDSPSTLPPVQMMLCMKQRNSLKINSHRWLFFSFGRILNPEIVVCIDVGTKLGPKALLAMWEAFYNSKNLGGVCGEVHCMLGKGWKGILNPLTAAQNFEYKISYQLDRPLEAVTGYVSVLPGAFSGFRYRAIMGRPLEQYFRGDYTLAGIFGKKGIHQMGSLKRNMYLAEDRIICLETFLKASSKWNLGYAAAAKAETDHPDDIADFIAQRRRWLNGAFSVTIYSIGAYPRILKSGHNLARIMLFNLQFCYNIVSFVLAWFSLSGYLLSLFIVNEISGDPPKGTQIIYVCTIVVQFVLALSSRPRTEGRAYLASFIIFGVAQLYLVMNIIYLFKRIGNIRFKDSNPGAKNFEYINTYFSDIGELTVIISGGASFGVYIAAGFLHLDPWHIFTSYAQYLLVLSSYTNILSVYAFSNFNDHTWGQKGWATEPEPSDTYLSNAKSKADENQHVIIEEPDLPQVTLDSQFEATVKRALAPYTPPLPNKLLTLEDQAKQFRLRLVGAYIFSNFFLYIFVLNNSFKQLHWLGDSYWHKIWFFRIWLWANAGCLYFRLLGCCIDRAQQALFWCIRRR